MSYVSHIRWTLDMTKKLVDEYGKHECLWNINLSDYRDRKQRDDAYEALRTTLDIPGLTCKELKWKIKNVRSTYSNELKKMFESIRTTPQDPYTPRVAWFKTLDCYLRQHITQYFNGRSRNQKADSSPVSKPLKRSSSEVMGRGRGPPLAMVNLVRLNNGDEEAKMAKIEVVEDDNEDVGEVYDEADAQVLCNASEWFPEDETPHCDFAPEQPSTVEESCDSGGNEDMRHAEPLAEQPSTSTDASRRGGRRARLSHSVQHRSVVDHSYTCSVASPTAVQSGGGAESSGCGGGGALDEFDAFGTSVAAQLRKMPLRMALRAQLQVQSYLTEARLYACAGYEDFPEET